MIKRLKRKQRKKYEIKKEKKTIVIKTINKKSPDYNFF